MRFAYFVIALCIATPVIAMDADVEVRFRGIEAELQLRQEALSQVKADYLKQLNGRLRLKADVFEV